MRAPSALLLICLASCRRDKASPEDSAPREEPPWPENTTCKAPDRPISQASVALERAYPGVTLELGVGLIASPDGDRFWAVEKKGRVQTFPTAPEGEDGLITPTVALDLSDDVTVGSETGLLGFALDPDFARNGDAYVHRNPAGGSLKSRVSRFHSDDGGLTFDRDSEELIFSLNQPYSNHNGGHLAFGPDGYLYIGLGDGGSAGDPLGSGQDPSTALGTMLRIDVAGGSPYAIPADNPFADGDGGLPEIYAWGLRNPWKYSFDRETGDLWVGDVGQDQWEEIDRVQRGGNYGWNTKEGLECFRGDSCDEAGLIDPVAVYSHEGGRASVTGGFVYRGEAIPDLVGVYLYTDYYPAPLWGLFADEETGELAPVVLLDTTGLAVSAFGEDASGEIYLVDYGDGGLYRLVSADGAGSAESDFPERLSETGCVDPSDPTAWAPGVFPYDVSAPLWSDGADKDRAFALLSGAQIEVGDDGDWTLPVGSVALKTFKVEGAPVETRLLVRHADGAWAGYSYAWLEDGSDAVLLPSSSSRDLGAQRWTFPSRGQCLQCHTAASGRTLGLESAQLNHDFTYPTGFTHDQLDRLEALGALPEGASSFEAALPAPDDDEAPVEARARALLHANCAFCHQPDSTAIGDLDLRYDTPLAAAGLCDVPPSNGALGVEDARLLAPGAPERSALLLRMATLDAQRMPPLGSAVVDEAGVALIEQWIRELDGCPAE